MVRQAVKLNGIDGIALTKLDVLDGMSSIRLCTAYRVDGRRYETVPSTAMLERAEPEYEDLPGWSDPTGGVRAWGDLPRAARQYVSRIEKLVGAPISIVSVGQARDQTIIYSALRWPVG
jgi:adenylosuccinate synthase